MNNKAIYFISLFFLCVAFSSYSFDSENPPTELTPINSSSGNLENQGPSKLFIFKRCLQGTSCALLLTAALVNIDNSEELKDVKVEGKHLIENDVLYLWVASSLSGVASFVVDCIKT